MLRKPTSEWRFWLAGAFTLLCGTAAQAADLVADTATVYDWTGFYIGASAGYAFGDDDALSLKPEFGDDVGTLNLDGFIGGGQVGANWQRNNWMFGVEADVQFADVSDSDTTIINGREFDAKTDVDWIGTMRLRSGFALDKLLIYGTGGLALGGVDYNVRPLDDLSGTVKSQDNYTATGWTAGVGAEWGLSERTSAKVEYLYYDLGSEDSDIAGAGTRLKITPTLQSVRVGIDFRF